MTDKSTRAKRRGTETERVRRFWNAEASAYDKSMGFWDKVLFRGDRAWVCAQAAGEVLEIAVGTGRNFSEYSENAKLTAIDISEAMLERAHQRAREVGRAVDLRVGDAQALEFLDGTFDAVVCTFSLCSIPDDRKAISEIGRVLRSGGRVLLAEHVRSANVFVRGIEHVLEVGSRGDHYLREPLDGLRGQGFAIDAVERRLAGFVERISGHKRDGSGRSTPLSAARSA